MTKIQILQTQTAALPDQFPQWGLPQVAFAGRSNVGKSSLLNAVTGLKAKDAARVSNTPGRTRQIHFYRAEHVTLVDLPGYGFAKTEDAERKRWRQLVGDYLESDPGPDLIILLVDARHEAKDLDRQLLDYARQLKVPVQVAATKVDKLSGNELQKNIAALKKGLVLESAPVKVSSVKGGGLPEILALVRACYR